MARTLRIRARILAGTILLGSALLAASGAPAHAQQASSASNTSAWFVATFLTFSTRRAAPADFVPAALRVGTAPAAAPNTSAWFVATYLQRGTPGATGIAHRFSLAGLQHRAAHPMEAGDATMAWYSATYLHPSSTPMVVRPYALAVLRVQPRHGGRAPIAGTDAWYVATYLGQPGRQ